MHAKLNPFLNNGISYISLIRPIKEKKDYILVAPDGEISSISRSIAFELGIDDY